MKKIFLLMVLFIVTSLATSTLYAQNPIYLSGNHFSYDYTGVAADSVTANDTMWHREIVSLHPQALYYQFRVKLTELTSPAVCTVYVLAKTYKDEDYTTISSQQYSGGGTDTTITFTQTSTKQFYRYYLVKVVYGSNKAKVTFLKMLFKY